MVAYMIVYVVLLYVDARKSSDHDSGGGQQGSNKEQSGHKVEIF